MKIQEIFEADLPGPGDFLPGNEFNPRSPDYDPAAIRQKLKGQRTKPFGRNDDYDYERPQKPTPKISTDMRLESGMKDNKKYNIVIRITGPKSVVKGKAYRFMDHEENIYHKFAGVDFKSIDEETGQAVIYLLAAKGSLIRQNLVRKHRDEMGEDPSFDNDFESPKPLSW